MDLNIFIPLAVLLVSIFIGRIINEKSYSLLPVDGKAKLIDLFSKSRIYGFIFIMILISILFLFPYFHILSSSNTLIIYIVGFILYFIGISIYSIKILKTNEYPEKFIKLYIVSIIIRFLGIAIFLAIIQFTIL